MNSQATLSARERDPTGGLLRDSLIYGGAAVLNGLIPFLLMPILTRILGPAEFGIVGVFAALVNVTSVLVGLSTHGLLSVKYFRGTREAFPLYVGACIAILGASSVLVSIGLFVASGSIEAFSGVTADWQWTIVMAAVGQFALVITLSVWQVQKRAFSFGGLQVANTALNMSSTLVLVLYVGYGWEGRALAHAVTVFVMGGVGLVFLARAGTVSFSFRPVHVREALRFGLPLVPHLLAAVALNTFDRLIVAGKVGTSAAGQYFAAYQIASVLTLGAAAINQAFMPWLFEQLASTGSHGARLKVIRVTYLIFGGLVVGGAVIAFGAPVLVRLLAGDGYADAGQFLHLLAPAATFSGMYCFVTSYIFYVSRSELLSIITGFTALVQVTATVALVDRMGAGGAAVSTLVGSTLYFVLTLTVAQRCVRMPWLDVRGLLGRTSGGLR